MKNITFALLACAIVPAICPAQEQTAEATPTPARYRSLEDANRKIPELKAENEALQIQNENAQLHRMSGEYDAEHPYPYYYPYAVPICPDWGGWGGWGDYHHCPDDIHHHYHYHHHHHH